MAGRINERCTKTKPAEGDMNRNEGKQMKSETMPKKDAETRNEVRRDTKTNVEERGKTRNEKKKKPRPRQKEAELRVWPCT